MHEVGAKTKSGSGWVSGWPSTLIVCRCTTSLPGKVDKRPRSVHVGHRRSFGTRCRVINHRHAPLAIALARVGCWLLVKYICIIVNENVERKIRDRMKMLRVRCEYFLD